MLVQQTLDKDGRHRTRAIQSTVGVGINASEHQIWVWVPRRTARNSSP